MFKINNQKQERKKRNQETLMIIALSTFVGLVVLGIFMLINNINNRPAPLPFTVICDGVVIANEVHRPHSDDGMFNYLENGAWKSRKISPGETCWGEKHEVKK